MWHLVAKGNIQQISYIPQTEQHLPFGLMLLRLTCVCVCVCVCVCICTWVACLPDMTNLNANHDCLLPHMHMLRNRICLLVILKSAHTVYVIVTSHLQEMYLV